MRKSTIVWLSIGGGLILLGALLFATVMSLNQWDFWRLDTMKYETNTYEIREEFHNIRINTDTADIEFLPSEDGSTKVVCYESIKTRHITKVTDQTLSVCLNDTRKWYDYITLFNFNSPKITVYLPTGEYADLKIDNHTGKVTLSKDFSFESISVKTSTGNVNCQASASGNLQIKTSTGAIRISDLTAGSINLSVSTGDITVSSVTCEKEIRFKVDTGDTKLTDLTCESLISEGDTGDITMKNVIASKKFDIERDTGDVKFELCDAGELFIDTDTGNVKGSLLSEKIFIVRSDTGSINVPKSTSGGRCEIETDTGDIKITVE